MSEMMRPVGFEKLMTWAVEEYRGQKRIFGVDEQKFYRSATGQGMSIFGQPIASPIGPAAGPGSQLAQNIVAAYLAGSRFMELKTVQKMDGDELRACVPRPCINAEDEGYNVEWSTELTVPQAYEEYVKAWLAVHVLGKMLGLPGSADVVFNMSVGYDLEGIKTEKIDRYIEGMKDASGQPVYQNGIAWLKANLALFSGISEADIDAIPARVSDSITLSTLHGCPPDEIERIANYLLDDKKVHTFVKCNPTLLGYQQARRLLDEMGYGYVAFDDHHFNNDLQYDDAVAMLGRLMEVAKARSLSFGVKITNTFPVKIETGRLPGEEMYMSGRALFPLSINVAAKLSRSFEGRLPISYSGGADAFNIVDIFKTGIAPVTVATTILKPGGYERLKQLAEALEPLAAGRPDIIDVEALEKLANGVTQMPAYRKEKRGAASRKTTSPLGLLDCFTAPCQSGGCPIEQRIPDYLKLVAEERYNEAFALIAVDNANPAITGEICNHACQGKCTRLDYESPLQIRNAKRLAAEAAQKAYTAAIAPPPLKTNKTAVVVGAGPAGISAALFLRRAGMAVTVLEKRAKPFGIVQYVIPAFRISGDAIARDYDMAVQMGISFEFNVGQVDVGTLRKQHDYVVLAVGAWKECAPAVSDGQEQMLDALRFLEESKAKDCKVPLGKAVAVIGGGDVAMDCARAAKRAPGVEKVVLVYRRTRDFMPAEPEEIRLALEDGVEMMELQAPCRFDGSTLRCEQMALGDWGSDGRRGIVGTGRMSDLTFDSVICAVGARVDNSLFEAAGLALDSRGRPQLHGANESSLPGVYVAGDCKAGPATVVAAIADAKAIAMDICHKNGLDNGFVYPQTTPVPQQALYARKGLLQEATQAPEDGERCLGCNSLCELCCDVCPNRANVRVAVPGHGNSAQILHLDALCNECGNCGVFCPHAGDPYKDKWTLFASEEDFEDSQNRGFVKLADSHYRLRLEGGTVFTGGLDAPEVPKALAAFVRTVESSYAYYLP